MKFWLKTILILALTIPSGGFVSAQIFTIDNSHTAVTSKVMRFEVVRVVGRFNSISGTINYNADEITKTTAAIKVLADSYSANNVDGENAIKSAAFLDVKKYPEINFVIKSIRKTGGELTVTANLSLHGVTKEVSFPVIITGPSFDLLSRKQSIGIFGKLVIDRQDYGIQMSAKMPSGGWVVGNDVEIEINALAIAQ